jgi:hypothetical protein
MLPLYCTYFEQIYRYVDLVDTFKLWWHDPVSMNKGTYSKKFDDSISYIEDIIPHSISIYKKIFRDIAQISVKKITEENDKGSFYLENLSKDFFCFCERYATKRVRTLSGYINQVKIFEFDFSVEPGKFTFIDQKLISNKLTPLELKAKHTSQCEYNDYFSSPIKNQIIDFFKTSSNAHIDTANLVRVHHYSAK